jgi:predicted patatin/cPLA2 family phospholipase
MKKKRALVLGGGGLCGAYSAGFMSELCRLVGNDYFDSVYCFSVGTTIGTFYIADEPDIIENTWRNYVDGDKLVKPFNFISGKHLLDLDYLISTFKGNIAHLNVKDVLSSKTDLRYALVDYDSAKTVLIKPNKKNIFDLIEASCSIPIINGPFKVGKKRFFDAGFVYGELDFLREIAKQHKETVVLLNFPRKHKSSFFEHGALKLIFPVLKTLYPRRFQNLFGRLNFNFEEIFNYSDADKSIKIIAPNHHFTLDSFFDTKKNHLNKMVDLGKIDARKFVSELGNY